MVNRARGWALWKALIIYDDVNPVFRENVRYTIHNGMIKKRSKKEGSNWRSKEKMGGPSYYSY